MRFLAALWIGKIVRKAMRLMGHNATYYPGKVALRICPDFLRRVKKPPVTVSVTGTNGKTTTANLICDLLELSGRRVLHNRFGTNLDSGIVCAFLAGSGLFGRPKHDIAVFETDERCAKRIIPYISPAYIIVTNLFRDSVARNAHPQYIADFLTEAIGSAKTHAAQTGAARLILCADDPISSRVAPDNPRVYFGIGRQPADTTECVNLLCDLRICPICAGKLEYEYRRYHHIGKFYCADCGFAAPGYDYSASEIDFAAGSLTISDRQASAGYKLLSGNIANVYNMLAAVALLREMGLTHKEIAGYMEKAEILSTRYSEDTEGKILITMQMAKEKNALAVTRAFDYIAGRGGQKQLLLMMSCLVDEGHWSENTCWLYDCDFEFLDRPDITRIVAAGPRAKDLYLRLLFAGIPSDRLCCVRDEFEAAKMLDYSGDSNICILYGVDSTSLAFKVREDVAGFARAASAG